MAANQSSQGVAFDIDEEELDGTGNANRSIDDEGHDTDGDFNPDFDGQDHSNGEPQSEEDDSLAKRQMIGKIGAAVGAILVAGVVSYVGYSKFVAQRPNVPAMTGMPSSGTPLPAPSTPISAPAEPVALGGSLAAPMATPSPAGVLKGCAGPNTDTSCQNPASGMSTDDLTRQMSTSTPSPSGAAAQTPVTATTKGDDGAAQKMAQLERENAELRKKLEEQPKQAASSKAASTSTQKSSKKSATGTGETKEAKGSLSVYSVKSIRSDQAWIDVGRGGMLVVQSGDKLPNGAKVTGISANGECVNTTKGAICP